MLHSASETPVTKKNKKNKKKKVNIEKITFYNVKALNAQITRKCVVINIELGNEDHGRFPATTFGKGTETT
jgi:hypothetical protein